MNQQEKKDSIISGSVTLLMLLLTVLLCAFVGFHYPDPPIPEEGVEVNLGDFEYGLGDVNDPELSENMRQDASSAPSVGEEVSTQNTEETVQMNSNKDNSSRAIQQTNNRAQETTQNEAKEPEVNKRALFPGNRNTAAGGSQGVTQGTGNQGSQGGDPNSQRYNGQPGQGGSGWSLTGRSAAALPTPTYDKNKEGKIIVKIWVDRNGKVIKTEAPIKGSTINDVSRVERAKEAAARAKFNADPNAEEIQTGTITYVFRRNN